MLLFLLIATSITRLTEASQAQLTLQQLAAEAQEILTKHPGACPLFKRIRLATPRAPVPEPHPPISSLALTPLKQEGPASPPRDEEVAYRASPRDLLEAVMHLAPHCQIQRDKDDFAIDNEKLSLLLCYAQGSNLALFGRPLFAEEIIKTDEGISIKEAERWVKEFGRKGHSPRMHQESQQEIPYRMIQPKCKLSREELGREIRENLQATKSGDTINPQLLATVFRRPGFWIQLFVELITSTSSDEEIHSSLQYAREFISFGCFHLEDLKVIKNYLEMDSHKTRLSKILGTYWSSSKLVKWPNQTLFEAFLGELFFPVQFQYLYENHLLLGMREPLQVMLALSCSYGNLFAQVEFAGICNSYRGEKEKGNPVKHFFKTTDGYLKENVYKGKVKKKDLPPYYCGLLCDHQGLMKKAEKWFKKGVEMGDAWCAYQCAINLEHKFDRRAIFNKLTSKKVVAEKVDGLESLVEAEYCEDKQMQQALFIEAGNQGVPEGYHSCARLAENSAELPRDLVLNLYAQAGHNHLLEGYKDFADYCIILAGKANREKDEQARVMLIEAAKRAYVSAGDKGAREAFEQLRIIQGQGPEADEAYQKSLCDVKRLEALKVEAGCPHE